MSSGEPDEEQEGSAFTHRLEMLKELVEAPDEAIEALYNSYGKSMFTNAGGAVGAAAGVAVGGPVGGIVGGVVGKKTAGKMTSQDGPFTAETGPSAMGAYPHLRRVGNLVFVSGMGPRSPETNEIPGGPVRDDLGNPLDYDITAQAHSVINNIRVILEEYGAGLENVVDVLVFLIDMDRDFKAYNEVYAEHFGEIMPARTTVSINALPSPIAIEMKVIAKV
jgi:2-aminomuconate deaminase